jgi:hypothetical protein
LKRHQLRRIYILSQLEGADTAYNMLGVMAIKGEVDRERFEDAFIKLIERHESLRTSFDVINGEVYQSIHEELQFGIEYTELGHRQESDIIDSFIRPFELNKAPLLRVGLCKIDEDKHLLMFDMSHIISDDVSMNMLIRGFMDIYRGIELPALDIQYKDFAEWQNEMIRTGEIREQEEFRYGWQFSICI